MCVRTIQPRSSGFTLVTNNLGRRHSGHVAYFTWFPFLSGDPLAQEGVAVGSLMPLVLSELDDADQAVMAPWGGLLAQP